MKNKTLLALAAILVCSCGSHRKADSGDKTITTTTKKDNTQQGKKEEPPTEYKGKPWVKNASALSQPTKGLQGRHVSLWASHGRYFNLAKNQWEWQRPYLYCTTEDLFTQTIVVPYLMPMLEKAGATVFSPRERDWQKNEVIVDNDDETLAPYYTETNGHTSWTDAKTAGFCNATNTIYGSLNPFEYGSTRKAKASKIPTCSITYQPNIPEEGQYAVYVSYPTLKNSVDDAEYTVCHKGQKTTFHVNQRMGGGTWVYLGTFSFSKGCSARNSVVLTNRSETEGMVTADAVRFGGGMGNIARNGQTSQLPRCLEGARYYAQWAGAPDSVYNSKQGTDDYKDDINVRSRMTNWLAGGSCYVPTVKGKKVPFDLSLAVHSDAGYNPDLKSTYGSLAICTTDFHDGKLASGEMRQTSKDLAQRLLSGMKKDLTEKYGHWPVRDLYDRNYSETRVPEVPSAIIETLSHQSFPDMLVGQDPNAKFTIARSLYKTILKYLAKKHGKSYAVAPLPPVSPSIAFADEATVEISWKPQDDPTEPTAKPTSYIVYTAIGDGDYDNGEPVSGEKIRIRLSPDALYTFKITAVNKGGESFATEALSAVYHPGAQKTILIVNGFDRLSAPWVRDNDQELGFDMDKDPGVQRGITLGWSGRQTCFDKTRAASLGPTGLGYSGQELEGQLTQGNTFDYPRQHAKAILSAREYNVVSTSADALDNGQQKLQGYHCVDYILGLERYTPYALKTRKTLTPRQQSALREYTQQGGSLLISGAYINTDMQEEADRRFLNQVLHVATGHQQTTPGTVYGMGTQFDIYNQPNDRHYAATSSDILTPQAPAFCTLTYDNGESACVAYQGTNCRTITIGFPFECIKSEKKQATIMRGFLNFLMK